MLYIFLFGIRRKSFWHFGAMCAQYICVHLCFPHTHTHEHTNRLPSESANFPWTVLGVLRKSCECDVERNRVLSVQFPLQHVASIYVFVQHKTSTTLALNIGIVHTNTHTGCYAYMAFNHVHGSTVSASRLLYFHRLYVLRPAFHSLCMCVSVLIVSVDFLFVLPLLFELIWWLKVHENRAPFMWPKIY